MPFAFPRPRAPLPPLLAALSFLAVSSLLPSALCFVAPVVTVVPSPVTTTLTTTTTFATTGEGRASLSSPLLLGAASGDVSSSEASEEAERQQQRRTLTALLERRTVSRLRDDLRSGGMAVSGKKADLIHRLIEGGGGGLGFEIEGVEGFDAEGEVDRSENVPSAASAADEGESDDDDDETTAKDEDGEGMTDSSVIVPPPPPSLSSSSQLPAPMLESMTKRLGQDFAFLPVQAKSYGPISRGDDSILLAHPYWLD